MSNSLLLGDHQQIPAEDADIEILSYPQLPKSILEHSEDIYPAIKIGW